MLYTIVETLLIVLVVTYHLDEERSILVVQISSL
jgi:hypothetical protein